MANNNCVRIRRKSVCDNVVRNRGCSLSLAMSAFWRRSWFSFVGVVFSLQLWCVLGFVSDSFLASTPWPVPSFSVRPPRSAATLHPKGNPIRASNDATTTLRAIEWAATTIEFDGFYRSYGPPSLWRKLTSSVPRREYALENVTFRLGEINRSETDRDGTIYLLLGASSSGKSTVLKSVLEIKSLPPERCRGSVRIDSQWIAPVSGKPTAPKQPIAILLDDRGDINKGYSSKTKSTVGERWRDCILRELSGKNNDEEKDVDNNSASWLVSTLLETMAIEIFELDLDSVLADLTPSERYRFSLGTACIESSVGRAVAMGSQEQPPREDEEPVFLLPGPILLLDEWMDVETTAVVQNVRPSLHKIASEWNGVVASVTHKPGLYETETAGNRDRSTILQHETLRKLTLGAGKLRSVV